MEDKKNKTPYYAVIFTSVRTEGDNGYAEMSSRMADLAKEQDGFLGLESARNEMGISVSYWESLEAISNWKHNMEHSIAKERGRNEWYKSFKIRIAKVEREYSFGM